MSASVLFDPLFPHGTPGGFRLGCRGSKCPAFIPCRDVARRYYSSDARFARRYDQGLTLAEIVELDEADAAADRPAKPKKPKRARKPSPGRQANARKMAEASRLIPTDELKQYLADGLTDREIAERCGLKRHQVCQTRLNAGLPHNPDKRGNKQGRIDNRLHEVDGLTDEEAAKVLGLTAGYIHKRRLAVKRKQKAAA